MLSLCRAIVSVYRTVLLVLQIVATKLELYFCSCYFSRVRLYFVDLSNMTHVELSGQMYTQLNRKATNQLATQL